MKIPQQYLPVMPYLVLEKASGFLDFTKTVFGATTQFLVNDPNDEKRIMHAEIKIFDAVIMLGQANDNWTDKPCGMFIFIEDLDGIYAKALENGAKSLMPPAKQDYGYSAGFEDPFGNHWWITQGES